MYFVSKNSKKEGPYPLDEVLKLTLTDDVLVWKEGMTDWSTPAELPELAEHVIKTPPALPKERLQVEAKEKLIEKRAKAQKIILNNLLIGILVALVLAGLATMGGQSGGSNAFPVYLTNEERNSPLALYWHLLPVSILIGELIMLAVSLYQITSIKPDKISEHSELNTISSDSQADFKIGDKFKAGDKVVPIGTKKPVMTIKKVFTGSDGERCYTCFAPEWGLCMYKENEIE